MFDKKSRYARLKPYTVKNEQGEQLEVLPVPESRPEQLAGYHLRKEGERLDLLAFRYLDDSCGFWRICELNQVMLPEVLSEQDEIAIPEGNLP